MYCEKCHKQSPDNFQKCPYCFADLTQKPKNNPKKKKSKAGKNPKIPFSYKIVALIILAVVLGIAAIVTGVLTGSKPESLIKSFSKAIQDNNVDGYYALFDENYKTYYKENWYFADEETKNAITEPLEKTRTFYTSQCGEDFKLKYEISSTEYFSDAALEALQENLRELYGYTALPQNAAYIDFVIEVKGETGSYKSVYNDFCCMKIDGKWYIARNLSEGSNAQKSQSETTE